MIALVLPVLAALLAWLGITSHWIWWWPAIVLLAAWIVYLLQAPAAFGKRADGMLAWWSWPVWAPLFAYQWLIFELGRRVTGEPVANLVAPGLWVGRKPRASELPEGIAIVVDLTSEFSVSPGIKDGRSYLLIPTLDARAPAPAEIVAAVDAVVATPGSAFIHCAHGHGRSATVAAAVMLRRGEATLDDVEHKLKLKRPRIGLNAHQRQALAAAHRSRTG